MSRQEVIEAMDKVIAITEPVEYDEYDLI